MAGGVGGRGPAVRMGPRVRPRVVFNPLPCGMRLRRSEGKCLVLVDAKAVARTSQAEEDEIALMFAGQYVDQARQLLADHLAKIARLKSQGKETTEAESMLRSVASLANNFASIS